MLSNDTRKPGWYHSIYRFIGRSIKRLVYIDEQAAELIVNPIILNQRESLVSMY